MPAEATGTTVGERLVKIETQTDSMAETLDQISKKLDRFFDDSDKRYVTQTEFKPIKDLVYGGVAFILIAFLAAVVTLVIVVR
jgi:hypothetical protein